MATQFLDVIRARVNSLCASAPFDFTLAATPFDFKNQPTGQIDQVFRIEIEPGKVIGGFNYSETRQDALRIWVARKYAADPEGTYQQLVTDATSLTAAVVRDGATGGGDYDVPDQGRGCSFLHDKGAEYALLRLSLVVDYETSL